MAARQVMKENRHCTSKYGHLRISQDICHVWMTDIEGCERVAYNQFVTYLTTKKRLTTKQNGSKKWHSTETSLLRTTDTFLKGIDKKKLTACVLLDMSKAFDSVDHQILLATV